MSRGKKLTTLKSLDTKENKALKQYQYVPRKKFEMPNDIQRYKDFSSINAKE